jgi:hypothetical protein
MKKLKGQPAARSRKPPSAYQLMCDISLNHGAKVQKNFVSKKKITTFVPNKHHKLSWQRKKQPTFVHLVDKNRPNG